MCFLLFLIDSCFGLGILFAFPIKFTELCIFLHPTNRYALATYLFDTKRKIVFPFVLLCALLFTFKYYFIVNLFHLEFEVHLLIAQYVPGD